MTLNDFKLQAPYNKLMGFFVSKVIVKQTPVDKPTFTDEVGELNEQTVAVLDDFLDYVETLDMDVQFVLSPSATEQSNQKLINAVQQRVEARGYTVLDCYDDKICEEIGIDWNTDFYNIYHTNYLGAEKYTDFFSKYLKEHYDLPDRRGDDTYQMWVDGQQAYLDYVGGGIKYYGEKGDTEED